MAKLYLKFEQNVLKEVPTAQGGIVTIGRLPDNVLQIDNLAVSGHHAKIYWEGERYVIEDNKSLNGTYLNNLRVTKSALKDGDNILIGKHTVLFKDEWHEDANAVRHAAAPAVPRIEATVVLDTKKAKEMMAQARAAAGSPSGAPAPAPSGGYGTHSDRPSAPAKEPIGTLTVIEGKTDSSQYMLSSKMSVIGKSAMASIKLKGSLFKSPPDVAAIINKRDTRYYIAPQDKKAQVAVNGVQVDHQQELAEGDVIDVAGVKMTFGYQD